jgi:hypothetical protein
MNSATIAVPTRWQFEQWIFEVPTMEKFCVVVPPLVMVTVGEAAGRQCFKSGSLSSDMQLIMTLISALS